jgi:apolipoprotein N-acyltransferase
VNFRNLLAALVVSAILLIWVGEGMGVLSRMPGEVNGVLVAVFTLIIQFYFRKRPADEARRG